MALPGTYEEWMLAFERLQVGENLHHLRHFHDMMSERVIRPFDDIGDEANRMEEEALERINSSMDAIDYKGDAINDVVTWANDHVETMWCVRQVALNLFAVGLCHLLEQQQSAFFQELLKRRVGEEALRDREGKPLDVRGLQERLEGIGLKVRCRTVNELRWTANTIKHGKGPSRNRLLACRPDLFVNPDWKRASSSDSDDEFTWRGPFEPLSPGLEGSLYVKEADLATWCEGVEVYWNCWLSMLQPPSRGNQVEES